ncbi:MAG TPA: 4Fe-4S dicluster domain-containing protein [Anaerolineales bacterium]|nr:4Fe-4S dicluster domain-containing protein [Anaerolineales bacterium]
MSFKVLPKASLPDWIDRMSAGYRVVGPKPLHGRHIFGEIRSAAELDLAYPTTVIPPKKYLFPQREDLLAFAEGGRRLEALVDPQPTVVLGLHTCDLHAIHLLDRVFDQGYADQHYRARREKTILVSIECLQPCMAESFCKSMGTLSVTEGFDLHLTDLGDAYAVDAGTEKGESLLTKFRPAREGTPEDYRRVSRVMSEKWPRFPMRLDFDVTELPSLLSVSYDSSLWAELGERCLACAMCTNVCPTCYCFNVVDEVDFTLSAGRRARIWDSCQLDKFATVAGGHNFRASRANRQRHRFFRKGKYQTDAFGLLGCVGCGRCAQACLVHITPVDTFNELYRRHANGGRKEAQA